jgi:outer membrane protein OmpA-like peptidoglycan-associated protein
VSRAWARAPLLGLAALAAACATAGKLSSVQDVLRSDIEKARKSGAERCAPKELALAEANVDFANHQIDIGQSGRAEDYLQVAEKNVKKALDLSKECGPRQLTVAKPATVVIEVKDSDGDGIPDDVDKCPLDPEDKDGFQDEDGCPDPDNDNDGIVDAMDACPNNPGPIENRGCPVLEPKYSLVEVKKDRIEIKQQVKFATAKFKVLPASYGLLDQVVQVLNDQPKMRVRIEGHTDSIGGEAYNLRLSQKRAESVRAYLVGKGVAPDRLQAAGYGLTRPIASNRTEKGRAQNRRTEFRIAAPGD